jgi:MinD superfamily P-loop ATPase
MKKLTIISGKGGTGKTSLTASFAALAKKRSVLIDADVDAANLSLITGPVLRETHDFYASNIALIDQDKCEDCGLCRELCRFNAIVEGSIVDSISCEGCKFCFYACPHGAVRMEPELSGQWFVSETPYGTLVHARLGIAAENSGKLVTAIRNRGRELSAARGIEYLIIDGPPGIGCPVIASLSGVDAALIVTEPTVSGIHDLDRAVQLCRHFSIPVSVCINRFDLAEEQADRIEEYCRKEKIALAGKIPFDRVFVDAMLKGVPAVEYCRGTLTAIIKGVWDNLLEVAR